MNTFQKSLFLVIEGADKIPKISTAFTAVIICFVYNCISNPTGAINQFMITIIDMVYGLFPSTPINYTIGYMLRQFASQYPLIGWGVVYEIFAGMSFMFGLWCVVKLWQLLPFT